MHDGDFIPLKLVKYLGGIKMIPKNEWVLIYANSVNILPWLDVI
jgi:hypothetical protein